MKILWCYHSHETSLAELSHSTFQILGFYKRKFRFFGQKRGPLTSKTSHPNPNTSRQKQIPTAKPKLFCFCCEVFGFAVRYFVFAVRLLVLPWGFWFCREVFCFCREVFGFAVKFLFLPWGFRFWREVFCFCREVFGFALTVVGHRRYISELSHLDFIPIKQIGRDQSLTS